MKQSILFTKTRKSAPKDEKSANAILLQRAGFIHKEMAGVYSFLPLGLRTLKKIEQIIREEMEAIGGQEIIMSVFQPKEIWQKTGRWSKGIGKEVMYKCRQGKSEVGLGPTHEEMLTNIIKDYVKSYEDLPVSVFQIQTKFRKEARSKSGILRGREFGMKDLYSFHADEKDFWRFYEKIKQAYFRVFQRCGLKAILTEASGGDFTEKFTHEFQVLAESGEDTIFYCPAGDFSRNREVADFKPGSKCPVCKKFLLRQGKAIEVGNIFPLGTKFSKALSAFYQDKQGKKRPIVMGSYGIGTSRLMGTVVEVYSDRDGIVWPESVAPFNVHLLALKSGKGVDARITKTCGKLYERLRDKNIEVLYDDRWDKSAGEKLVDADLIGIPWRIIISERTIKKGCVEIKKRNQKKTRMVKINQLLRLLKSKIKN